MLGCGTGTEPAGTESQRGKEFAEVEGIIDEEGKIEIDEEAWKTAIAAAVDRMETGIANLDADIADAVTIRPDPDDAYAYSERGMAYLAQGKFDEAIADFTEIIRLASDNAGTYSAGAYYSRGVAYEKQGNKAKADADFAKAESLE